jgi:dynein heavy chain
MLSCLPPLQVFGLHANADISYYTSDTRALWGDLVDLQPRVGAAAGAMSREEFVAGIVCDISAKLPEQFDLPLLAKGLGVPSPTQVVLLQELARWNGVLEAMNSSLQDLQRALSGGCAVRTSMCVLRTCCGCATCLQHVHSTATCSCVGLLCCSSQLLLHVICCWCVG